MHSRRLTFNTQTTADLLIMHFTMTAPCSNCPFRTDIRPFLRPGRAREIADALIRRDQTFPCHKTVDYSGETPVTPDTAQHCAGALIMLEHMERPNQMMRICERLGSYDRTKLKMDSPVYRSDRAFIAAHLSRKGKGS